MRQRLAWRTTLQRVMSTCTKPCEEEETCTRHMRTLERERVGHVHQSHGRVDRMPPHLGRKHGARYCDGVRGVDVHDLRGGGGYLHMTCEEEEDTYT